MPEIWFTADTHFGHERGLNFRNGNFLSIDEHDRTLCDNWNSIVSPNDTVYHLGDVSFGNVQYSQNILNGLHGKKHLLLGNHDYRLKPSVLSLFESIAQILTIRIDEKDVVLCHYPLMVWPKKHYEAWHLHGHSHGNLEGIPRHEKMLDVGVDIANEYYGSFRPINWEEIREILKK